MQVHRTPRADRIPPVLKVLRFWSCVFGLLAATVFYLYHTLLRTPSSPVQLDMSLKVAVANATAKHTATCIFLHGLGDSSAGWSFLPKHFKGLTHIKWIFPNAPVAPVTINGGMPCPSWYDIYELGASASTDGPVDQEGIMKSVASINAIIQKEIDEYNIPSERILIGGFSQGCVVSMVTGITSERKLAGIVGLSGYLPFRQKLVNMATEQTPNIPVFWGHGTADPVVRYEWGQGSAKELQEKFKMNVEFHSYKGMGHSADLEELQHMEAFINKVLPATPAEQKL